MSMNLQYSYAHVQPDTGLCTSCMTFSYEINHPEWIAVYYASDEYVGKYYNFSDGLWYYDAGYTEIFDTDSLYN